MKTAQDYADGICSITNPKNQLIKEALIKFAKLHVEAALKEASEKQIITAFYEDWNEDETELIMEEDNNYEATYEAPVLAGGKVFVVDKESILNSYSLENIK